MEDKLWKTLSRETVLQNGKWLTVENHTVELPDGRQIQDWPWVITPDYINVLAVTAEGKFLCFRQNKYAVKDGLTLGIVGVISSRAKTLCWRPGANFARRPAIPRQNGRF